MSRMVMASKLAVKGFPMQYVRLPGQLIFFMKNMATQVRGLALAKFRNKAVNKDALNNLLSADTQLISLRPFSDFM